MSQSAAYVSADNTGGYLPLGANDREAYAEIIDRDRTARHELGLSEPPDYAVLIRAHTKILRKQ